jgi:PAS domain S-box-containing protein
VRPEAGEEKTATFDKGEAVSGERSEDRFKLLFDSAAEALFLHDLAGRFVEVNRAACDSLGYSREELLQKQVTDIEVGITLETMAHQVPRILRGEQVTLQGLNRRKDGTTFPVEVRLSRLEYAGRPHIVASARDITGRKDWEEDLQESEARYRSLFQNHHSTMLLIDPQTGAIMDANPAACDYYGYSKEELLAKKITEINTLSPEQVFQQIHKAKTEQQNRFEFNHRLASGEIRDVEVFSGPIRVKGRELLYSIIHDVTARKRMEEALRESQTLFQDLVETAQDLVWQVDIAGRYTYLNPAWEEVFGYKIEEMLGKCFTDFQPPAYAARDLQEFEGLLNGNIVKGLETVHLAKDGMELHLVFNAKSVRDKNGQITGSRGTAYNITKRKRAEEALRDSEQRLSELFDFLPDATFAIDLEGKVIAWNRAIEEMTGVRAADIIGKGDYEYALPFYGGRRPILIDLVFKPDDEIEKKYSFVKRQGDILLAEAEVPLKGEKRLLWGKARPLYNATGKTVGALEAIRDITDHRRAVEALQESEARFRQVVESSPLPIAIAVEGGRIEYVNRKFGETFGYTLEDVPLLEDWYRRAYPDPDYREEKIGHWRKALEQANREGRPAEIFEVEVTCKDGSQKIIDIFGTMVGNKTLGVFNDITERKRAGEVVRESEARFRLVVENSPLAIVILHGDQAEYLNPKFLETFGYTLEDMPQLADWFRLAYPNPDYRQWVVAKWRQALEEAAAGDGIIQGLEVEVTCKDGAVRTMESWGVLVGGKILVFCKDLTEIKKAQEEQSRLEAQMQEVQKLESLGVLAGGIAHDFNNLLMAILGNADLALLSLSPASPARPNVEEIARASQRAADLCRQMLAYSGKGRFLVGRYDLTEVVREMTQMLTVSVSKKVSLQYSFAADLPAVEVDATQMRQVIMNLITNASESLGDESGVISVATGVMDCDRAFLAESHLDDRLPEGRYVYLEVADTGCGMSEETRRRIFDPFFTTKFTGRGLGLAAVLGILRGHRGAIKVKSQPGRGTTFTLLLPAVAWEPGDRVLAGTLVAPPRRHGTVLLVDDDPHVRRVAEEMLKRLGLMVLTADHGKKGVEIFRAKEGEIDCVLLDLTMPGMGGEETFQAMREVRPDVRVILSSGYDEQEVTRQFAGMGLSGFIQKPYTVVKLQEVLDQVLF